MNTDPFDQHRPRLFGIAYRILGSGADADDVLQEARIRWTAHRDGVLDPKAFLVTVVTRLCLDEKRAAASRARLANETWVPEPVPTDEGADTESLSFAFLLLLERLSSAERAAFLLHEVFEHTHAEVGEVLGRREDDCRQLVSRARQRLRDEGRRAKPVDRDEHARLLMAFGAAVQSGQTEALTALLAPSVQLRSDGGGVVRAAHHVLRGAAKVAKFLLGVNGLRPADETYELREVNGLPAIVCLCGEVTTAVIALEVEDGAITAVYSVVDPRKLARV